MLEHIGRVVVVAEEVQLVDLCPGSYPRHQGLGSASKGLEYLELFDKEKGKGLRRDHHSWPGRPSPSDYHTVG